MKLHDKQFYDKAFDQESYVQAQIERHRIKRYEKRQVDHYLNCVENIIGLIVCGDCMVCMVTRNNHERDVFRKGLASKSVNVYSLDISPLSNADYVMDFNTFPQGWDDKWGILFSNALDHAVDATDTFNKWLKIVKPNGIIVLGFDMKNEEEESSESSESSEREVERNPVGRSDCCSFKSETVDRFVKSDNEIFQFVGFFENSYKYYVLRKK